MVEITKTDGSIELVETKNLENFNNINNFIFKSQ